MTRPNVIYKKISDLYNKNITTEFQKCILTFTGWIKIITDISLFKQIVLNIHILNTYKFIQTITILEKKQ